MHTWNPEGNASMGMQKYFTNYLKLACVRQDELWEPGCFATKELQTRDQCGQQAFFPFLHFSSLL